MTASSDAPNGTAFIAALALLQCRTIRRRYWPAPLDGGPAWDLLVALYVADSRRERLSGTELGAAAGVLPSTLLRWLSTLEHEQVVSKQADPHDRRRTFIGLTPMARRRMIDCLDKMAAAGNWHAGSEDVLAVSGLATDLTAALGRLTAGHQTMPKR